MGRDRFTARVQTQKRRKYIWISVSAVVVLLLGAIAWTAWSTTWLAAKETRVIGLEHLAEAEVLAAAEVPADTSMLQIDLAAIEERVAELPIADEVTVSRDFPNTVMITVRERQAVAWLTRGSRPWAVDNTGVDYRQLKSKPKHIPQLKVDRKDEDTVRATAEVAADLALIDPELLADIAAISAKSKDSIELELRGGKTVAWGDAAQTDQKAQTLSVLLTVSAQHYDVSAPERPTTKD